MTMTPEFAAMIEKHRDPNTDPETVIAFLAAQTYETPVDPAFM